MFAILTVCTGNICRSPVAEMLIGAAVRPVGEVVVSSAGTGALVDHGVPEQAQRLARSRGIDASSHRARQIDKTLLRSSDLVLAMARDHRRLIAESVPATMRRTFTLRELARIVEHVEPQLVDAVVESGAVTAEEGMRAGVALAAAMRGTVMPPSDLEDFDVVDPYKRSDATYARSFNELAPAADAVSRYLLAAAKVASNR